MELLPGFVSFPRLAGSPRPAGAFFSAEVLGPAGQGAWQVRLEGRVVLLRTDLPLVPGQILRLRNLGAEGADQLFQLVTAPGAGLVRGQAAGAAGTLVKGIPAAQQALERWKGRLAGSQADVWAADLNARSSGPADALTSALSPWLDWTAALEQGRSEPPPDDEAFWDLWNARRSQDETPWIAFPVRWDHEGASDAGLLRARWQPVRQSFDFWSLTAAPARVGFRLEADASPGRLGLVWRFFDPVHRKAFEDLTRGWDQALSDPALRVTLKIAGARSVDVQA